MHAVYIHIPFCKSICTYCDFCKVLKNPYFVTPYLNSLIKEINDFDDKVETDEGLKYITVETEGNGDKYTYIVAFYEADDAFWMIQFGTKSSNFDKYKDDMLKYAKSVKLD